MQQIPVSVEIAPAITTLVGSGSTAQLRVRVFDAKGQLVADPSVSWSTTDERVASVDADGLVQAMGSGMVRIVALVSPVADTLPIVVQVAPKAYVTNSGSGTVSVVDLETGTVDEAITVDSGVTDVAIALQRREVLVTNYAKGTLTVIPIDATGSLRMVTVGGGPHAVAPSPDEQLILVTQRDLGSVAVVEATTLGTVAVIGVGLEPTGVAFSVSGDSAFVVNRGSNTVSIVDVQARTLIGTIAVGSAPQGIAVSRGRNNSGRAVVSDSGSGTVTLIHPTGSAQLGTTAFGVGAEPVGIVVTPDGQFYWVTDRQDNTIWKVPFFPDPPGIVPVGTAPHGLAVSRDGNFVAVTNRDDGTVTVVDALTLTVRWTVPVGLDPLGVAIFPGG